MTSTFPGSVPSYPTWKESNAGTRIIDEEAKVPAGAPYRGWLIQKPRAGDTVTARIKTTNEMRKRVEWGSPILPGTYAIRDKDGAIEYHPNDANLILLFTYVGVGSVVRADIINALQDDMKAVMNWIGPGGGGYIRIGDYDPSENALVRFAPEGGWFIAPANMYQDDVQGAMICPVRVRAQRGFDVRAQRYGLGGSASLQSGWNRILTVGGGSNAVHGFFEIAYSLPGSIRGRLFFFASAGEANSAQLTIIANTCNGTNNVFSSMRILKPSSAADPAAVEVFLSSPASVILEIRQVDGGVFEATNQGSYWSFVVPATAGSLSGMTDYNLNVSLAAFGVNCNNIGLSSSSNGGVTLFQGPYGVFIESQALCPTIAEAVAIGTTALPFGPVHCVMDSGASPENQPVVRYNPTTKSLVSDAAIVYANGTFNLVDSVTSQPVTVTIVNGIVTHMEGVEE